MLAINREVTSGTMAAMIICEGRETYPPQLPLLIFGNPSRLTGSELYQELLDLLNGLVGESDNGVGGLAGLDEAGAGCRRQEKGA